MTDGQTDGLQTYSPLRFYRWGTKKVGNSILSGFLMQHMKSIFVNVSAITYQKNSNNLFLDFENQCLLYKFHFCFMVFLKLLMKFIVNTLENKCSRNTSLTVAFNSKVPVVTNEKCDYRTDGHADRYIVKIWIVYTGQSDPYKSLC